jgi:HlyD family secretion protein
MSTPASRPIEPYGNDLVSTATPRGRGRRLWQWVVLAAVLLLAWRWWHAPAGTDAPEYVTGRVDRGPIEQVVSATGTVNPVKTVQVGTYVSGPIIAIDVDFNSPVKEGQRVAKIDPAPFLVKVRGAEASLGTARGRVEKDRADLELKKLQLSRSGVLTRQRILAQNDLDTAQSAYDQAVAQLTLDEASIRQAEASLEEAQVNLRYSDILSPVDGVVVARNVDVGQTVAASFQTPTLFLIAEDLTKMQVNTNVSESDVGRVQEGQAATFVVDAYPGTSFHGIVAQVRNAPITVQNVVTYDVVVAVDNPDQELKPGMTANVTITTARRADVLRVPARALRFRPIDTTAPAPKGRKKSTDDTVYVVTGQSEPTPVAVTVGIRDAEHAEVTSGDVKVGDAVAVGVHRDEAAGAPTQPPSFVGGGRRW